MARIELDAVTKQFPDGTTAVSSLDLAVGDGELLVLVGPSGCGKTTALRMVAGLEDVTSGTISIDGRPVNDVEPRHRDIAMVFQSYALYPHLSVYDNMAFSLRYRKVAKSDIRQRVAEAARILELEPFLQRKPRQLSGGQRQRVAMGRAIVRDPAAFLMDEPLSNLDAKLRVQTRTEVSRLQRRLGTTMVYVTHDQTEAMTLGDRVAVMRSGMLQQFATPKELYDRPDNLFVAGFMGSPAMNFLPGTVEEGVLRTPLGDLPISGQLRQELERAGAPRDLIVGIRPENFEDASLVSADARPNGVTFRATVDVLESLGSDVFVHFAKELEQGVDSAELRELAQDSGRAGVQGSGDEVVARIDAATGIREGDDVELWADTRSMHVFDPATGKNLALADGAGTPPQATSLSSEAAPSPAAGDASSAPRSAGSPDLPAQ